MRWLWFSWVLLGLACADVKPLDKESGPLGGTAAAPGAPSSTDATLPSSGESAAVEPMGTPTMGGQPAMDESTQEPPPEGRVPDPSPDGSDGPDDSMLDLGGGVGADGPAGEDAPDESEALDEETPPEVPDDDIPELDCQDMTQCGVACVDLDEDPNNCGFCGRTCVIPNGMAGCDAGECAIEACAPNYFDVDGDVNNGCEAQSICLADELCETSCGSQGATACEQGTPVCAPPLEVCNAADDNCDGQCDEGVSGGCRAGVHRAHGNGHIYSSDMGDLTSRGYNLEAQNYFYLYNESFLGMRPVHLCEKPNGMFLLSSAFDCEIGREPNKTIGFWASEALCGSIPLYRLSSPGGNHFYTTNAGERDNAANNLGYIPEGVAGYVWPSP